MPSGRPARKSPCPVTDHAQQSKTYDASADVLRGATNESINYLGVALYGPRKPVLRLTGSLALLR